MYIIHSNIIFTIIQERQSASEFSQERERIFAGAQERKSAGARANFRRSARAQERERISRYSSFHLFIFFPIQIRPGIEPGRITIMA
jgi:hypothetical protein